jgi:hypothetical protein
MRHSDALAFLTETLKPDAIRHANGSLLTHLQGTHRLLKAWGNSEDVCLAGLFHSVYGTIHFRPTLVASSERSRVRRVIGTQAERLVYWFSVANRPDAFLSAYNNHDGHSAMVETNNPNRVLSLNPRELTSLLEIEAANLAEQHCAVASYLVGLIATDISEQAKSILRRQLLETAVSSDSLIQ